MIKFKILREVALSCMRHEDPIAYYSDLGKMSMEVAEYELSSILKSEGADLLFMLAVNRHFEVGAIINNYLNKEALKIAFRDI